MRQRLFFAIGRTLGFAVATMILVPCCWAAKSAKVYKFHGAPNGLNPQGGLVADTDGNFYGTTTEGGHAGLGTVFKLSRGQGGHWTEAIIYSFTGGADGEGPQGDLSMDAVGNLYGTAIAGGIKPWGTVFRLTPNQSGGWTETTLYNFQNGLDGAEPTSGVMLDTNGDLFGTASTGGVCTAYCGGTIFELIPSQNDTWTETTLYNFLAGTDGWRPYGLVSDASGNLYGTTGRGGNVRNGGPCGDLGCGTVFELSSSQNGSWSKAILYSFTFGLDGAYPSSGVSFDGAGDLYGETAVGGSFACPGSGCGVIYKLTYQLGGGWEFSVAHTFNGLDGLKGNGPIGGLTFDTAGNAYGATQGGGDANCVLGYDGCGILFKLTPAEKGDAFSIIAAFDGIHGGFPQAGVAVDQQGNLYGTAEAGGDLSCAAPTGCGVVFAVTP